jgi:hypothetical protein
MPSRKSSNPPPSLKRRTERRQSYLDEEFVRYAWANWDGLGQPYLNGGAPSRSLLCWPIFYRSLPVSLNPQGGRSHKTPLGKEAKQRLTWPLQNNNKASPLSQDDKRPSYSHHPYAAQHPPHHETGRLLPILDNNTSLSSGAQKSIQLPEQSSGRALGIGQQTSIILGSLGMVILLLGLFVVVSARYGRSRRVGRKGKGSSGAYAWAAEAEENMVIDDSMLAPERRLGF